MGILFTVAANHLNSEISQTPDYQLSRKISSVTTGGGGHGSGRLGDRGGRGRGGRGGRGSGKANTGYHTPAEWEKLSFEERDKIRRERDRMGGQGGSKRSISEMTTKQPMTEIIISIQKSSEKTLEKEDSGGNETPKKPNMQGDNAFGGRESAKRSNGMTHGFVSKIGGIQSNAEAEHTNTSTQPFLHL